MKKRVIKIIWSRATCGKVAPPRRNPARFLTEKYNATPAKERPALIRKWLREIAAFNLLARATR